MKKKVFVESKHHAKNKKVEIFLGFQILKWRSYSSNNLNKNMTAYTMKWRGIKHTPPSLGLS
jgi:hypothetical protein